MASPFKRDTADIYDINTAVSERFVLYPPKLPGLLFHLGALFVLAALTTWGILQAARASLGPQLVVYLVFVLVGGGLGLLLAYRGYALLRAYYLLERDGIHLNWGLRSEVIPMNAVLWVRPASELEEALPLPFFRWPGAVTGMRQTPGSGRLEFFAARTTGLVLIATPERTYVVSPDDPQALLRAYQRLNELGSTTPLEPQSIYPSFLLARMWRLHLARYMLLGGLLLNLALLTWASLVIPGLAQVRLGFGAQVEPVPGVQLLLLPFLSGSFFLLDLLLGLYFFRRAGLQPAAGTPAEAGVPTNWQVLAYILWGSGLLTAALFLAGLFFILQAG